MKYASLYTYTPDSGLTDTYSMLADPLSCGLHCRSFGHTRLHSVVTDTLSHCSVVAVVDIGSTRVSVE